jgi:hypothetical protein
MKLTHSWRGGCRRVVVVVVENEHREQSKERRIEGLPRSSFNFIAATTRLAKIQCFQKGGCKFLFKRSKIGICTKSFDFVMHDKSLEIHLFHLYFTFFSFLFAFSLAC